LGKSVFDHNCPKFHIHYTSGIYQYLDSTYAMIHTGKKVIGLYDYERDQMFKQNLMGRHDIQLIVKKMELNLKMSIQTFNNNMVNDQMTANHAH
ncbi:MAG: hypothetical protein WAU01_00665, partial [Saprospiraceae bacterium]